MARTAEKKDYKAIVGTFNGKLQKALKEFQGEPQREEIKKAVKEMLGEIGVPLKKSE